MRRGVDYAALAGIRRGGSDDDEDEDGEDAIETQAGVRRPLPSRQHRAAGDAGETPLSRGLTALALTRAGGVKDPNKVTPPHLHIYTPSRVCWAASQGRLPDLQLVHRVFALRDWRELRDSHPPGRPSPARTPIS